MIGPAAGVALYQFNPPLLWVLICMVSFLAAGSVLTIGAKAESGGVASIPIWSRMDGEGLSVP